VGFAVKQVCKFVRNSKGSHEVWLSQINGQTFPVAVTFMSEHLANEILRQAGIKQKV
jgi:hypothetical protein